MKDGAEEKQQLTDVQEVEAMLGSRGWAVIKNKLDLQILDLQNINNIDTSSPDTMQTEIKARILAFKLLYDFLKQEVYGFVEQQRTSHQSLVENTGSDYIVREKEG